MKKIQIQLTHETEEQIKKHLNEGEVCVVGVVVIKNPFKKRSGNKK